MLSETQHISGSPKASALTNPLVAALREKSAASFSQKDFEALSVQQLCDLAANAGGFHAREHSWRAVEHLCSLAMARALKVIERPAVSALSH